MEQQALPLKDIHLPAEVSWWPLAPGWWILIGLFLLSLLAWYFRKTIRRWLAPGIPKIALNQLDTISGNNQLTNQQKIQQISQLLRKVALSTHPREQVAGLAGQQWLEFLDSDDQQHPFSTGAGRILIDAPYRPDVELDIDELIVLTRRWIKQAHKKRQSVRLNND